MLSVIACACASPTFSRLSFACQPKLQIAFSSVHTCRDDASCLFAFVCFSYFRLFFLLLLCIPCSCSAPARRGCVKRWSLEALHSLQSLRAEPSPFDGFGLATQMQVSHRHKDLIFYGGNVKLSVVLAVRPSALADQATREPVSGVPLYIISTQMGANVRCQTVDKEPPRIAHFAWHFGVGARLGLTGVAPTGWIGHFEREPNSAFYGLRGAQESA